MKILKYIGIAFIAFIALIIAMDFLPGSNYHEAKKAYQTQNYQEALQLINKAIEEDSSDAIAYELRGKILFELNDTLHSKQDIEHSLQLIESKESYASHTVRKELISWDISHGNKEEAEQLLKKELESLEKDDSLGRVNVISYIISEMQEMNDTISLCNMLENTIKKIECIECKRALGFIYSSMKKNKLALKHLNEYLDTYPKDVDALNKIGLIYQNSKNKSKAEEIFSLAKDLGSKEACLNLREITAKISYKRIKQCCDGTSMKTTGKGACSHHGGVCNSKIPIKEYTVECN
jgi:tetratricopeptide (TPR) repeat protein